MELDAKILVTGSRGLVGSAVMRRLFSLGYTNVIEAESDDGRIDLRDPQRVNWFFSCHEPEYVFHCAARVGGIKGNAENQRIFLTDNLAIQNNVLMNAAEYNTKKLVFLGSSCIYPRDCPQPIKEEYLLAGPLEKTNEGYALAKIAGLKLCEYLRQERGCNFVTVMPCNLFGPNDNFDAHAGHVVPGMMARMHSAKVTGQNTFGIWGDGTATRELMYSDELADALMTVMDLYDELEPINAGSGREMTMLEIAQEIAFAVRYDGTLIFDPSQPSGTPRKILDSSRLRALGWKPDVATAWPLQKTYEHFLTTI